MKKLNSTGELEDHRLVNYRLGYFSLLQLTDEQIRDYEQKFEGEFRKVQAFYQVKATLAPCIEALILLDRLAFLQQQVKMAMYFLFMLVFNVLVEKGPGMVWSEDGWTNAFCNEMICNFAFIFSATPSHPKRARNVK